MLAGIRGPSMFGLLNVNKPQGITSRDAVNRVQRLVRGVKVGHAGTLDPLATGVLVVCLGPATRLVEYVQRMPKRYEATFLLGRSSDTEDLDGQVVQLDDPPRPAREDIEAVLPRFRGAIDQVPPAFSALHVDGARAYDLARRGQPVALRSRTVTIHNLHLRDYAYPEFKLSVACGSGTYIRSLGRDIAWALGTAAVMSALERTAIGHFRIDMACQYDLLTRESIAAQLLPPRLAVSDLPTVSLTESDLSRVRSGQPMENRWQLLAPEIAGLDGAENLATILAPDGPHQLRPLRNFAAP
jgi:tRNA pseudouridine55 synthase